MADETALALQNLGLLNRGFAENFAPINNFTSQNAQLAIAKEHARVDQANKIAILQQQAEADRAHQEAAMRTQFDIARMQEQGANQRSDHSFDIAKFQAGHEDAVRLKTQADAIRANPQARRVLGQTIATLPDNPNGNGALVAAYTKAFSDPKLAEKLDVEEAKGLNTEIKSILGRLTTSTPGSAQSKQAVLAFLSTPGVTDLLIKKGKLTVQEVNQLQTSGDSSKVIAAIQKTAESAYTPWGERDYLTQLIPAWNTALASSGAQNTPESMVNATSLKALLDMRDKVIGRGNIYSDSAMKDIFGETSPTQTKLPPPPASAALAPTIAAPVRRPSNGDNPFAPPAPVDTGKVGLAAFIQSALTNAGTRSRANQEVNRRGNLNAAFHPEKLAEDPYTEFELRKQMLDSERSQQATGAGITAAIPFAPVFKPTYTAFNQVKDEDKLQDLVAGLYAPNPSALEQQKQLLLQGTTPSSPPPPASIDQNELRSFFEGLLKPQK